MTRPSPSATSRRTWPRVRAGDRRRHRARAGLGLVHPGPGGRGLRARSSRRPAARGTPSAWPTAPTRCSWRWRRWASAPGDEVITSPLTAAFTALAILRAGARPVFADVDAETLNALAAATERARSRRGRGRCCRSTSTAIPADLDRCSELAHARGLPLVEDACQAHGARVQRRARRHRRPGSGALSFYPTKNLGAFGDGGAVLAGRRRVAARAAPAPQRRPERPLPPRRCAGINSRLDEMQAAVLRVKLRPPRGLDRAPPRPGRALRGRAAQARALRAAARAAVRARRLPPLRVRHPRRDALRRGAGGARRRAPSSTTRSRCTCSPPSPALGRRRGDFPVAERAARRDPLAAALSRDERRGGALRGRRPCARRAGRRDSGDPRAGPVPAARGRLRPLLRPRPRLLLALLPPRENGGARASTKRSSWPWRAACASPPGSALLLAELGVFSLVRAAALLSAAAALRRRPAAAARLSAPLPRPRGAGHAGAGRRWCWRLAFLLQARPSEYVVGGRDPGVYVAAMALIGRTGGIAYTDPGVLSIPPEDVELFYREPAGARLLLGPLHGRAPASARPAAAWCPSSSTSSPPSARTSSRPWA